MPNRNGRPRDSAGQVPEKKKFVYNEQIYIGADDKMLHCKQYRRNIE